MSFRTIIICEISARSLFKSNFELVNKKFVQWCIAVQISKNLLETKPLRRPRNVLYFELNQLCDIHA